MNKDIKKGLVPKLRFSEFEDFGEWEEKTVGQIVLVQRDLDLALL